MHAGTRTATAAHRAIGDRRPRPRPIPNRNQKPQTESTTGTAIILTVCIRSSATALTRVALWKETTIQAMPSPAATMARNTKHDPTNRTARSR